MALKLALCLGFLVLLAEPAASQVQTPPEEQTKPDCTQKLAHAEDEFNSGHFYGVPSHLKDCLESGDLSTDERVRAYMMLCQVYLILDDPIAAGDNYLRLLRADPEFIPNDTDHPIDIVYLSKQYTARPVFTPHFRIGLNTAFYRQIYPISTEPYSATSADPIQFGFQLGGGLDWNINDNISVCLESNFSSTNFERTLTNLVDQDETLIQGNQLNLDLPLYAKYGFTLTHAWRPFVYSGLAASFLFSASNQFTFTDNKSTGAQLVAEGPSESVTNQRNRISLSWIVGLGTRYKIGKNYIYADLRYMAGLTNVANDAIYYQDPFSLDPTQIGNHNNYLSTNATRYHYISDLFRMDNISLSFGFVKPLYDPRKVKKARTKSVARAVRKGGKKK